MITARPEIETISPYQGGKPIEEVNQLIKQFEQMSKMMKMMQAGKGKHIMQMMQKFR